MDLCPNSFQHSLNVYASIIPRCSEMTCLFLAFNFHFNLLSISRLGAGGAQSTTLLLVPWPHRSQEFWGTLKGCTIQRGHKHVYDTFLSLLPTTASSGRLPCCCEPRDPWHDNAACLQLLLPPQSAWKLTSTSQGIPSISDFLFSSHRDLISISS